MNANRSLALVLIAIIGSVVPTVICVAAVRSMAAQVREARHSQADTETRLANLQIEVERLWKVAVANGNAPDAPPLPLDDGIPVIDADELLRKPAPKSLDLDVDL